MHKISLQFMQYLFVGVINTVFGYALFAFFIYLGLHYAVATIFSTTLGIIFNFYTIGNFVFHVSNRNLFKRFVIVYSFLCFLSIILLKIGTSFIGNIYFVGALCIPITAMIGYLLNRNSVFQRP